MSIRENVKDILIPSEEVDLDMYPMDFEEFLWARGDETLMEAIRTQFVRGEAMGVLHKTAMEAFREYLVVGGMPKVVGTFFETHDMRAVDRESRENCMKIDFLVAKSRLARKNNIHPVEVKSGKKVTHRSLDKFRAKYADWLSTPYLLWDRDCAVRDGVACLPLYMTPLLSELERKE